MPVTLVFDADPGVSVELVDGPVTIEAAEAGVALPAEGHMGFVVDWHIANVCDPALMPGPRRTPRSVTLVNTNGETTRPSMEPSKATLATSLFARAIFLRIQRAGRR